MVNQASYVALAVIVSFGILGVGPLHETVTKAEPLEEIVVTDTRLKSVDTETEDYDPWERFNEKTFAFKLPVRSARHQTSGESVQRDRAGWREASHS